MYKVKRFSYDGDYKSNSQMRKKSSTVGMITGAATGATLGIPISAASMGAGYGINKLSSKVRGKRMKPLLKTKVGKIATGLALAPTALGAMAGHATGYTIGGTGDLAVNSYRSIKRNKVSK